MTGRQPPSKDNAMKKIKRPGQQKSDLPTQLSQPAQRALAGAGISQLRQLTRLSEAEVGQLHGIGPNALDQLRRALAANGLSFAGEKPGKARRGGG
jgi:hypothetical protein